jgi:hypothetical protein
VSKRVGWEVEPGAALDDDQHWQAFLEEFMRLHDERKANDWASYERLLTQYIGADEHGRLRENAQLRCLRATMLGYLKSGEVIAGGDCKSCNRCDPSERFQATIEERVAVVQRLAADVAEILDRIEEEHESALPTVELLDGLIARIAEEDGQGRSASTYVFGWLGGVLDQTPDHRGALLLTLLASLEAIERSPDEPAARLVEISRQLAELSWEDKGESSIAFSAINRLANTIVRPPLLSMSMALVLHGSARSAELEERYWLEYLSAPAQETRISDLARAYACLMDLSAPGGPLSHPERYVEFRNWRDLLYLANSRAAYSEEECVVAFQKVLSQGISIEKLAFLRDRVLPEIRHEFARLRILTGVCQLLDEPEALAEALENYIRLGLAEKIDPKRLQLAHEKLVRLAKRYAPDQLLADRTKYEGILLRLVGLQRSTDAVVDLIDSLPDPWEGTRLSEAIAFFIKRDNIPAVLGLLARADASESLSTLDRQSLEAIQQVDLANAHQFLLRVGSDPFRLLPQLALRLAEQKLSAHGTHELDLIQGAELCAKVAQVGLPIKTIEKLYPLAVRRHASNPSAVLRFVRAFKVYSPMASPHVYHALRPLQPEDWVEWFTTFSVRELVSQSKALSERILSDLAAQDLSRLSQPSRDFLQTHAELLKKELADAPPSLK